MVEDGVAAKAAGQDGEVEEEGESGAAEEGKGYKRAPCCHTGVADAGRPNPLQLGQKNQTRWNKNCQL